MSLPLPLGVAVPTPPPSPIPVPSLLEEACGERPGTLCRAVLNVTNSEWLASSAEVLLAKPARILLIVAVALIARALLHRAVTKLVDSTSNGSSRLASLRNRAPGVLADAGGVLLSERREQRAATVGSILRSIASFTVFTVAGVMILGELGLNLAPIVASAGIVGIAVGFGAQNLIKDFLTGMFMILEDQYGVGDVIDAGEASGSVEAVGLRTTRLRDVQGVVWHIRNGEIIRVGNMSQGWSRALIDVPIAYSSDIVRVREIIKEVADSVWRDEQFAELILEEPEVWGVEQMTANGLAIRLVVKTAPLKQWDVARELRQRLKSAFDAEGVEVPMPARPIWIRTAEEGQAAPVGPVGPDSAGMGLEPPAATRAASRPDGTGSPASTGPGVAPAAPPR